MDMVMNFEKVQIDKKIHVDYNGLKQIPRAP